MSYDVDLVIDTGGALPKADWPAVYQDNYTSNVTPMWRKAGLDLAAMDGWSAVAAAPVLATTVAVMTADPQTYKAMEPDNGWGDYPGALAFLLRLLAACREHPRTELRVGW